MVKSYELCVLFGGGLTPAETDVQAKQVEDLLAGAGAEIKFSISLGRKKLAYKISGNTHGEYRSWLFTAEAEGVPALNAKLRLANFVVRHLLTSIDEKTIEKRVQKAAEAKVTKHENPEEEPIEGPAVATAIAAPTAVKEEVARPIEPEAPARTSKEKAKVSFEDLDKKLDEILENDTI